MIYSSRELIRWWPKRSQTRNRSKERENVIPGANDLSQTPGYPGHLIFTTLLLLNYRTGPLVIALRPDNVPVGHMWPPTAVSIETIAARCETPPFFLSLFLAKNCRSTVCQDRLGTNTRQKNSQHPGGIPHSYVPSPSGTAAVRLFNLSPTYDTSGIGAEGKKCSLSFLRGVVSLSLSLSLSLSVSFFIIIIIFHGNKHVHLPRQARDITLP